MIELGEEIEGDRLETNDYFFDRIGEAVPVKPTDSNFNLESLPSQPLAVSERLQLIFVAHSEGFCVARTKDVIESAKEIKGKGSGSSIEELSIVNVPLHRVHILTLSADSSTLAASVAGDIHFFSVNSLLKKEQKPYFSCSLSQTSSVKDLRWNKKLENSYIVLSKHGELYCGAVEDTIKNVMDNVDAIEWSVKGHSVAVARKNVLSILSSKFKERLSMSLSFKSWIGNSDVDCLVKVDSIRWVRNDSIILGCFQQSADGKEENYLVQVIKSKSGKITNASSERIVLSFCELFSGLIDDILPYGSGPNLLLSYLEQCELAITANRKNTDQHIVLIGSSASDDSEAAVIDIGRDNLLPRIELQENGDDNLILGLCIDKASLYDKVEVQLGGEEHRELSPYCVLLCLTLEGKLLMFHVASVNETPFAPQDTSALSDEEDTPAALPSEYGMPKLSAVSGDQRVDKTVLGFQLQEDSKNEGTRKGGGEISLGKNDLKPSAVNRPTIPMPPAEEDTPAALPSDYGMPKLSSLSGDQRADQIVFGFQPQEEKKNESTWKGGGEISLGKNDLKPSAVNRPTIPMPLADQITHNETVSGNQEMKPLVSSQAIGVDGQQKVTSVKSDQDIDKQISWIPGYGSTISEQSSLKTSLLDRTSNVVGDLSKTVIQKPVGVESCSSSFKGEFQPDVSGQSNYKELQKSVEVGKELSGRTGSISSQSNSSQSWSSGKLVLAKESNVRSSLSLSNQRNRPENAAVSVSSGHAPGNLVKFALNPKDNTGHSTLVRSGKSVGQGTSVGPVNIEQLPSISSLQLPSQESSVLGKSPNYRFHPAKETLRNPQLRLQNSEPNLSKQFGNVKEMTKELDTLLECIQEPGGFKDACTVVQKSSVEALEQGIGSLSEKCRMWRSIMDGQLSEVQHLLNMTLQVLARKIYMEGIVKQATDIRYWDLWNHQKLNSELELKRRHILEVNQELTNQLIELERHFNTLELNKFGVNGGANVGRRAFQSKFGPPRHMQSLHSLHNTMNSQLAAAEQLSDCLSKQMAVLSIESPVKQLKVRKELFETIGIPYDGASFGSPEMTKAGDALSITKIPLSSGSAIKDQSRGNQSSAMGSYEPDSARRRRDSLDRSWASFEPPKTTVKRMLLQGEEGRSKSSLSMDKHHFSPHTQDGSASTHQKDCGTRSTFLYPPRTLGSLDASSAQELESSSSSFSWAKDLPGPIQAIGCNSTTLQRLPRNNLSAVNPALATHSYIVGQNSPKGTHATAGKLSGGLANFDSVSLNETKYTLQTENHLNQTQSIFAKPPAQVPSLSQTLSVPKDSSEISTSSRKETALAKPAVGSLKHSPVTTEHSSYESQKGTDSPFDPTSSVPAMPVMSGRIFRLDSETRKNELGVKVSPPPTFQISLTAPSMSLSAPPSSTISSTAPNSSPATSSGRSLISSQGTEDAIPIVSTPSSSLVSSSIIHSSSSLSSKAREKKVPLPVFSPVNSTSESSKTEFHHPMDKFGLKIDVNSTVQAHGSQSKIDNTASHASNLAFNAQPEQPLGTQTLFPASESSGSAAGRKSDNLDVAIPQEDEMEEEAPETSQLPEFSLGSLSGFGIGSVPNTISAKPNPFGTFSSAANPASSPFSMAVPSGELFRPPSFSIQSPQISQPSPPTNLGALSGGFTVSTAQAPTESAFGQPAQIGPGQQALGSVLGAFGQSRQLGAGLSGGGFASASGFGGGFSGTPSSGGFLNAAGGGGFAGVASSGGFAGLASSSGGFAGVASPSGRFAGAASASGGFAGAASTGGGFGGVASASSGFAGAASTGGAFGGVASAVGGFSGAASTGGGFGGLASAGGGFAGAASGGGLPVAGGGFSAFSSQGFGAFSAFGSGAGGTAKPPSELFTQIRK